MSDDSQPPRGFYYEPPPGSLTIKDEHPDDRKSRIGIKEADATAARKLETARGYFIFSVLGATVIGCLIGFICGDATSVKPFCQTTLASIISASVAYVAGEAKGKQSKSE